LSQVEKRISHQKIEAIVGHESLEMAKKYTKKMRDAQLVADTMNRELAAHQKLESADTPILEPS
jgi:hypothetical protein